MEIITLLTKSMQSGGIYFVAALLVFVIIQLCLVIRYFFKKHEAQEEKCRDCMKELHEKYYNQIQEVSHIIESFTVAFNAQSKTLDKLIELSYNNIAKG